MKVVIRRQGVFWRDLLSQPIIMNNEIDDRYLGKIYDDMQKEHQRLSTDIRTGCLLSKENEIQRQMQLINSISMNCLKLLNLKKKIRDRMDS